MERRASSSTVDYTVFGIPPVGVFFDPASGKTCDLFVKKPSLPAQLKPGEDLVALQHAFDTADQDRE